MCAISMRRQKTGKMLNAHLVNNICEENVYIIFKFLSRNIPVPISDPIKLRSVVFLLRTQFPMTSNIDSVFQKSLHTTKHTLTVHKSECDNQKKKEQTSVFR